MEADPVICIGTSVTYTTEAGQSNYIWNIPDQVEDSDFTISAGGLGTSSNTVTLTWLTDGAKDVTVLYTDPNGCTASSLANNSITVDPLPVPTLTSDVDADPIICVGNTVTYTTTAGQDNYIWDIQGVQGTDYTLTFSGSSLDESNSIQVTWLTDGSKKMYWFHTLIHLQVALQRALPPIQSQSIHYLFQHLPYPLEPWFVNKVALPIPPNLGKLTTFGIYLEQQEPIIPLYLEEHLVKALP